MVLVNYIDPLCAPMGVRNGFICCVFLKGPFTYSGSFMVNYTAYQLLIGISLSF